MKQSQNAPNPGGVELLAVIKKCAQPWWGFVVIWMAKMRPTLVGLRHSSPSKNAPNPGGVRKIILDENFCRKNHKRAGCDTYKRVLYRKMEILVEEASLLSLSGGMCVEHIQITKYGLVIELEASHPTACCSLCTQLSDFIKTHYRRVLRDTRRIMDLPDVFAGSVVYLGIDDFSFRHGYRFGTI